MILVHKEGRRVTCPAEWRSVFEPILLERGFTEVKNLADINNNAPLEEILMERPMGGLGDMINILPAVESKLEEGLPITVAMPGQYNWMFKHLPITYVDFYVFALNYIKNRSKFKYFFDFNCPAGKHEEDSRFRITRNRIENFADFLNVTPKKPVIKPIEELCEEYLDNGDIWIGIVLKTANGPKDYPIDRITTVVNELKKKGYRPVTIDQNKSIIETDSIVGVSQEKLTALISQLDLVITPDTGILHLVGALDIKGIGLFGPTDGKLTCKYYPNIRVIQKLIGPTKCYRPCYYSISINGFNCGRKSGVCMLEISEKEIIDAVDEELSGKIS